MERVGTLVNKLTEQLEQGADAASMLVNAQLLLTELQAMQQQQPALNGRSKVAVFIPSFNNLTKNNNIQDDGPLVAPIEEEKPVLFMQEENIAVEEELVLEEDVPVEEEVQDNSWLFNMPSDIPTLNHQPAATRQVEKEVFELNELLVVQGNDRVGELNERLREDKVEVATMLQGSPVRDLRKAIGINDRYLFVNELFRGDESMYERSLKTINAFTIYPEAQYWIERELKVKMGWKEGCETAKLFDQLVRRRFS